MKHVRELFRKFRSSDGRIKALTATGILALAAVAALAMGVLPALGTHGSETVPYGGGDGGCAFVGSEAAFELHINNPQDGFYTDPVTGAEIEVDVSDDDKFLKWRFTDDGVFAASDITINGGSESTWTVYEPAVTEDWVEEGDGELHAPAKPNGFFSLSHLNLCYDIAPVDVLCGVDTDAVVLNDGVIIGATVRILGEPELEGEICKPDASFYIDNTGDFTGANAPVVFLDFGEGTDEVPIRFDVYKDLASPPAGGYPDLLYSETLTGPRTVMSWCNMEAADGRTDFADVLMDDSQYPTNDGVSDDLFTGVGDDDAILCKVFEGEDSDGQQQTTGFGKLTDPGMW